MTWQTKKLSELCDIEIGRTPSRNNLEYWNGDLKWVSISDMKDKYITDTKECITEKGAKESNCKVVPKNTLLMSFKLSIGKLAFTTEPVYTNEAIASLKIKDDGVITNEYLYYALQTMDLTVGTDKAVKGLTLNKAKLNELKIAYPSKEEQEKIVSILDKADEIRAKKKLANDKLDEFLKSTFISMFGDSKANPKGFELKELQTISNVGSSKRVFVNELVENGIPFYRGTEIGALAEGKEITPELFITEEHYKELCDCTGRVKQGDLLLPSICPDGRIWQVQDNTDFYFKDGRVLWIRPNSGENSTYIRYALKELFQSDYTHIASGTTFAELKIFILKTLNIMYPPMEQQNKFAKIVEKVEAQKQKNEKVIEQMNNLFNSLSQRAFKGEL